MTARVVPWRDWSEWRWLRDALYSGEAGLAAAAVQRVKAWETRQALPQALLMTARLVEIRLIDGSRGHQASAMSAQGQIVGLPTSALQLMYALCIMRAVNGLADSLQKGVMARSVSSAAATLGLPPWLVDIRHDAAHNDLPSMGTLRMGCDHLLGWYYEKYWSTQDDELQRLDKAVQDALNQYVQTARKAMAEDASEMASVQSSIGRVLQLLSESAWRDFLAPAFENLIEQTCGEGLAAADGFGDLGDAFAEAMSHAELLCPLLLAVQTAYAKFLPTLLHRCADQIQRQASEGKGDEASVCHAAFVALVCSEAFHQLFLRWEQAVEQRDVELLPKVLVSGIQRDEKPYLQRPAVLQGDYSKLSRLALHRSELRDKINHLPDGAVRSFLLNYFPPDEPDVEPLG
uniref:Uncharacterized protein n=1 Tax=Pinguiococcus pyrenoidosus TaxID=172671 RepID=A0A7R9UFY9_9STRA